ncbi:DUF262 domain-containing protein [Solirubrobacter phytolaccae]|uniref:DUF262 domain-containing protein n=1 Tax=Solirubrobacter phytolaccae TaxID=1404360 RepID=A0A9X3N5A2_9ACTN|nr:DUF262 domain-containing protein [Solirubrobacter phytolaccae]MDA0179938.1 DUF262 domain-containing protein [Solirubrobacter phytolaccae]
MFVVEELKARPLRWWVDNRGLLDLAPPYQRRGGLWSVPMRQKLIDSIINGYDLPKFYLADFASGPPDLNTAGRRFAVVDGRQRLEAIFRFADDELTLEEEFVLADEPALELAGLTYSQLRQRDPRTASRFDEYRLTMYAIRTNEEGRINELFTRLNSSRALSGAEVRNAMKGVVPGLIREIADHELFTSLVRFSRNRYQDREVAAKYLLCEFRGNLVETKRAGLDRLVREGTRADADPENLRRAADRVLEVCDRMASIFEPSDRLLSSQGSMVPYYWLARTVGGVHGPRIRAFLLDFEELRHRNRRVAADPRVGGIVDPDLLRYDALNRSINDQGSIEGRFAILMAFLNEWLEEGHLQPRPSPRFG